MISSALCCLRSTTDCDDADKLAGFSFGRGSTTLCLPDHQVLSMLSCTYCTTVRAELTTNGRIRIESRSYKSNGKIIGGSKKKIELIKQLLANNGSLNYHDAVG